MQNCPDDKAGFSLFTHKIEHQSLDHGLAAGLGVLRWEMQVITPASISWVELLVMPRHPP